MSTPSAPVLFVDDDGDALISLIRALQGEGAAFSMHACTASSQALDTFKELKPRVAVIDLSLDERRGVESGFELLSALQRLDATCRIIVLTGHGGPQYGVRALTLGAASFLEKPADILHLKELIRDGVAQCELRRSYTALLKDDGQELSSMLTGSSPAMQELRAAVSYAAKTTQPVLLTGETGSGKGVCAMAKCEPSRLAEASRSGRCRRLMMRLRTRTAGPGGVGFRPAPS